MVLRKTETRKKTFKNILKKLFFFRKIRKEIRKELRKVFELWEMKLHSFPMDLETSTNMLLHVLFPQISIIGAKNGSQKNRDS